MKKCTNFEEQKGTRHIRGNFYFDIIIFSCFSSTKLCLRSLLICFAREIKGFYQSYFENDFDFTNMMNISPNMLTKKKNLKKLRHGYVDYYNKIMSSCNWKTLVPFCLRKKRPENAFLTLTVNYRKIAQKNKLCHPKLQ